MKNIHWQSRDNARTPMQWDETSNGGFSGKEPWLRVNPNYTDINVKGQENDEGSILNFYRQMIAFRKAHRTLVYGDFILRETENCDLFIFDRQDAGGHFTIWLNMSGIEEHLSDMPVAKPAIGNYMDAPERVLRPWEGRLYRL